MLCPFVNHKRSCKILFVVQVGMDGFRPEGRVAIVCGASRGLGKAISFTPAREGVNLVICARGKESLELVAKSIKEKSAV